MLGQPEVPAAREGVRSAVVVVAAAHVLHAEPGHQVAGQFVLEALEVDRRARVPAHEAFKAVPVHPIAAHVWGY